MTLKIAVLKDRYQTRFMTPRYSQHTIKHCPFVPFNKLRREYDGFTILAPQWGSDFIHAHNRLPLISGKFIASHESGLPRMYGLQPNNRIVKFMQSRLESNKCRRIIGMSHYANRCLTSIQEDLGRLDKVAHKLMVRHPNVELGADTDNLAEDPAEILNLTFVGGHFGRKGGGVCVRIAELAHQRGLPMNVNIVSTLAVGESVWTDPTIEGFFDRYFDLLRLPNVTVHKSISNLEVRQLFRRSHFCMLPTFADTFGYSAIEAMAEHTPVIATNICALPEFVENGVNGFLFDLQKDAVGTWAGPGYDKRHTLEYANYFAGEIDRLAIEITDQLEGLIGDFSTMSQLRHNARRTAEMMFAAEPAGQAWDNLYQRVADEPVEAPVKLDTDKDRSSPDRASLVLNTT